LHNWYLPWFLSWGNLLHTVLFFGHILRIGCSVRPRSHFFNPFLCLKHIRYLTFFMHFRMHLLNLLHLQARLKIILQCFRHLQLTLWYPQILSNLLWFKHLVSLVPLLHSKNIFIRYIIWNYWIKIVKLTDFSVS